MSYQQYALASTQTTASDTPASKDPLHETRRSLYQGLAHLHAIHGELGKRAHDPEWAEEAHKEQKRIEKILPESARLRSHSYGEDTTSRLHDHLLHHGENVKRLSDGLKATLPPYTHEKLHQHYLDTWSRGSGSAMKGGEDRAFSIKDYHPGPRVKKS